jgi:hypothetical protein
MNSSSKKKFPLIPFFLGIALVLGATTGVLLANKKLAATGGSTGGTSTGESVMPSDAGSIKVGTIYGSKDEAGYPTNAEGILVAGGVGGEGSHHLVRPGGASQNVYLSSSVVDLDLVVGDRVQVWGQTMGAKKAGWLIDVGRLKVLELNAPMPE